MRKLTLNCFVWKVGCKTSFSSLVLRQIQGVHSPFPRDEASPPFYGIEQLQSLWSLFYAPILQAFPFCSICQDESAYLGYIFTIRLNSHYNWECLRESCWKVVWKTRWEQGNNSFETLRWWFPLILGRRASLTLEFLTLGPNGNPNSGTPPENIQIASHNHAPHPYPTLDIRRPLISPTNTYPFRPRPIMRISRPTPPVCI